MRLGRWQECCDAGHETADKPDSTVADSRYSGAELGSADHEMVHQRREHDGANRVDEDKPLEVGAKDDL
jgi:hypothetical protein